MDLLMVYWAFPREPFFTASLPGMQSKGVALTKVPKIKFVLIISGGKFGGLKFGSPKPAANNAFSSPVKCPSLHIIGEKDFLKERGIALLESFENPTVIHHSKGHIIPRLDGEGLQTMLSFIDMVQKMP
ncbi:uncharacterized protein LOC132316684 [Cornus florida]|uniref:uncharacterized protein LOC132316684 n=1 Tax=Cornus florida TaxID=4283 RepID=UPI0028983F14|nr:uncharacterized protein LOC132316684 [Cornus florida]